MNTETDIHVSKASGGLIAHAELKELGNLLLKTGSKLMTSGANMERVRKTIQWVSAALGHSTEPLIANRVLSLTTTDNDSKYHFKSIKRTASALSWFPALATLSGGLAVPMLLTRKALV